WIPIVQLDKLQAGRSEIGEWITYYARLSFVQSIFILIIGYGFYHYKYHKRYFFSSKRTVLIISATMLLGITLSHWLSKPRYQKPYGKTIIAGQLVADTEIKTLSLNNNNDIAVIDIPIKDDGSFYV